LVAGYQFQSRPFVLVWKEENKLALHDLKSKREIKVTDNSLPGCLRFDGRVMMLKGKKEAHFIKIKEEVYDAFGIK